MSSLSTASAAATGGSASAGVVEYEVLYYERKNKVHKSKGVSKFDGTLRIAVASGEIRLLDASANDNDDNNSESSDEDDEDDKPARGKSKQKKFRKQQQHQRKPVPFQGRDKTLAQKCCELQDEEIIVLGAYELQIVSRLSQLAKSKSKLSTVTTQKSVGMAKKATTLIPKRSNPLLGNSVVRKGGLVSRKVISKPLSSATTHNKATGTVHTTVSNMSSSNTNHTLPNNAPKAASTFAKLPPAQPTRKPLLSSSNNPLLQRKSLVAQQQPNHSKSISRPLHKKQLPKQPTGTNKENNNNNNNSCGSNSCDANASSNVCPNINLPASLRTVLRPHQVQGVEFLWKALTEGPSKGAILADEMGLGKTLMTITVICGMFRKQRDKHFIVVCPSSLVSNWAKEFDKWIGKTSQPKRVIIQKGDSDNISRLKSVYSSTKSMGGQVLILSYELFRRVTEHFTQNIGLLVVDEGHRLKNQDGLTVNALEGLPCEAKLCITATPVQNNLREFYNLANFVLPGVLGEIGEFRKAFERPIAAMNQKNASREQKVRGKEQSKELDALIKPFMLRRLQKDVLKSMLPPRTEVLLFCRPTTVQSQMYEQLCRQATSQRMSTEALTTLTNLRKLCSHPFLVNQNKPASGGNVPTGNVNVSLSGKLIVLQGLLRSIREQGDKVVIVSNFTSVLSLIESTILQPQQLSFCRLDGSTDQSERQALVDNFNRTNSSVFAFLLSSKAGGCGLNLIGANRLVMVDADWNPATDAQATARIYRPGQTKPCHIYRLFTTGTVEEVILQRQIAKGSLAVLNGSSKSNEKFTKEELADCFTLKDCKCDTKRKLGKTWAEYDGPDSLEAQGISDETLRFVADHESTCNVLSFVHAVDEKEDEEVRGETAKRRRNSNASDDEDEGSSDESSSSDDGGEDVAKPPRKRPAKQSFIDSEAEEASFDEESSDEEMEF